MGLREKYLIMTNASSPQAVGGLGTKIEFMKKKKGNEKKKQKRINVKIGLNVRINECLDEKANCISRTRDPGFHSTSAFPRVQKNKISMRKICDSRNNIPRLSKFKYTPCKKKMTL